MGLEEVLAEYDRLLSAMQRQGQAELERIDRLLRADRAIKIHSITLRVKERDSLSRKLARPDRTYARLAEVTDVVGVRVICYFEDGVEEVAKIVEGALPVDFAHSVDKRRTRDAGGFGYRSLHYVCALGLREAPDARFEIQVRTMLDHAWAEIEHDLGYKALEAVPAVVRRRLSRLAGLLEIADQEFVAIRRDLDDYAAALPARIAHDARSVPLDRLSLSELLARPEVVALDTAIAAAVGRELGDEPFYPEYLLKMLVSSGLSTVAAVHDALTRHGPRVPPMVGPYFAFTWDAWRLSPQSMRSVFRGYSLFFVAHAEVLVSPALGISKVERLTSLYRELDYPDDEGAARRVAIDLARAFERAR
jgi:ppGpp synthetase/RelA/SpoT-type nucleotidyltranferase